MRKSDKVKERIMEAAIALITESSGDVTDINTRAIAERAGVGIGLINYHFQTKEHLIERCVERIIGDVISAFHPSFPPTVQTPIERLKHSTKLVGDFLMSNPAMSRISILSDFKNPRQTDNTMKSAMEVKAVAGDLEISEKGKEILAFSLISAMQALFLRKGLLGYNMNNKEQRDELLDMLIDTLFRGLA